jgi:hypothetical protein
MGNKQSGQTFPSDAVVAQTIKTINIFGPLYVKAYSIAVARKLQRDNDLERQAADRSAVNKEGYMLDRPPVATEPLERGWMTKLGEVKKNWKRRYFVAKEEADNFVVYYFEKESDSTNDAKAKGVIYPCGYIVRSLKTEEEVKQYGEHALTLSPLDRKRTYYLRCDNDEQRTRWKMVLRYAASKCSAPLSPDPAAAEAFRDAYARARRAVGLGGYYKLDRPEPEQLAVLCAQACEATALASIYEQLAAAAAAAAGGSPPSGSSSSSGGTPSAAEVEKLKTNVDRELDRIVGEAVATAWPTLAARIELRKDAITKSATANLGAIIREGGTRRAEVRERAGKHIRPLARDASVSVINTVLGALLKPLYKVPHELCPELYASCLIR